MAQFEAMLAEHPVLADKYRAFLASLESSPVPTRLLDLCRAQIQLIHGVTPAQLAPADRQKLVAGDVSGFTAEETAALVVAERIPYQHHQLLDEEVAAVKQHLGEAGTVTLLTALAFMDVQCRLDLTTGAL